MMFSWLRRNTEGQIEDRISALLRSAATNHIPGEDAVAFNAAGDLCNDHGFIERAVKYYGLAVDAYLQAERWDAAAAICRKILRIAPAAVRARCTLAWLAIGKDLPDEAHNRVGSYVAAARRSGNEPLAIAQLKRMGEVARDPRIRLSVGEQLLALEADRAADFVLGTAYRDRNAQRRPVRAGEQLWFDVRRAALQGPAALAR